MFDVDKIKDQVVNKPVLILFDNKESFANFSKDFLINHLNYYTEKSSFERLMLVYDSYYGEYSNHPNDCVIELTINHGGHWGHCWKGWYQNQHRYTDYIVMHYTDFLIQSIKISKDSLMDFLNK